MQEHFKVTDYKCFLCGNDGFLKKGKITPESLLFCSCCERVPLLLPEGLKQEEWSKQETEHIVDVCSFYHSLVVHCKCLAEFQKTDFKTVSKVKKS